MTDTQINRSRVADLLCTGLEQGSGYWATRADYDPPPSCDLNELAEEWRDEVYPHIHYPLFPGGAVILEDDLTRKRYRLDWEACVRGLQIMQEKYPRHFAHWVAEEDDAETGDVFIQCATLGEIIYG